MNNDQLIKDLELAERLCKELLSGNKNAIDGLIRKYNEKFRKMAEIRLYQDLAEELMNDYWVKLTDGKAICNYEGINKSSFQNYLIVILIRQICDYNRKKQFNKETFDSKNILINGNSPEKIMLAMEKQKIMNEALLIMTKTFPNDAILIEMRLDKKSFQEIARSLLKVQEIDENLLEKKSAAIRKQFKRKNTGSLARFKKIVERLLKKYDLTSIDMIA